MIECENQKLKEKTILKNPFNKINSKLKKKLNFQNSREKTLKIRESEIVFEM